MVLMKSNHIFGSRTMTGKLCLKKRWKLLSSLSKMQITLTKLKQIKKTIGKEMTWSKSKKTH